MYGDVLKLSRYPTKQFSLSIRCSINYCNNRRAPQSTADNVKCNCN